MCVTCAACGHAFRGVDYCYHAAALKQVPSCEFHPMEAVRTNVLGTENVLEAAVAAGVKRVVCLSTDKAVYPINAMGISKAMMEKVMVAQVAQPERDGDDDLRDALRQRDGVARLGDSAVRRAGAARASRSRSPIRTMTRFMMTLDDAVDLVLYAFEHGRNGDIFVQKAPAATIEMLAQALLRIMARPQP